MTQRHEDGDSGWIDGVYKWDKECRWRDKEKSDFQNGNLEVYLTKQTGGTIVPQLYYLSGLMGMLVSWQVVKFAPKHRFLNAKTSNHSTVNKQSIQKNITENKHNWLKWGE